MLQDIERVLLSEEQLRQRVRELGEEISKEYAGKEILMIGVLRGAVMFMADLARAITVPVMIDFMAVSSYGMSTSSSGIVRILKDLDEEVAGKHVLIVEDIVDSGHSMRFLLGQFAARRARSLRLAALVDKDERREVDVKVDFAGFKLNQGFIVGYGLDYAEHYRMLPGVFEVIPE